MYKCSISLENFRIFGFLDLKIPETKGVIIKGGNGSGKTSLLEAIFYLFYGVSFRDKDVYSLINHTSSYLKVSLRIGEFDFLAFLDREGRRKITFNGEDVPRNKLREYFIPIYSMGKDNLLDSAYSDRRRILDKLASLYIDGYRKHISAYERLVKNKKEAILKGDSSVLKALNEKLYELYSIILNGRKKVVERLSIISHNLGYKELYFEFRPSLSSFKELEEATELEVKEGRLLKGASYDILETTLEGRDLRKYFSHGEKQYLWYILLFEFIRSYSVEQDRGVIMLMDEAFSVLDEERTRKLVEHVLNGKDRVLYFFTSQRKLPLDIPFVELGSEYGRVKANS